MLAPRRVPPCLTCSVAVLKIFMNETGPGGHAAGGAHIAVLGSQPGKGKAGAAAGLVDQGGIAQGAENALHAVLDRQHEAGRQLPQAPAGIHQGRGVGQEFELGHQLVEGLLDVLDALVAAP